MALAGQPDLCLELWGNKAVPTTPQARPVHHWLRLVGALFPAFPGPLLRLLRCLSADSASAAAADGFLKSIESLACLHEEQALIEGTVPERGGQSKFKATQWLPVAGLIGLDVPEASLPNDLADSQAMMRCDVMLCRYCRTHAMQLHHPTAYLTGRH